MIMDTKKLSTGERGAVAELKACVWLLGLGYDVFRNVTPNGKFDIVAIRGSEIRKIDVTTMLPNESHCKSKREYARANGGNVVYVGGGICKWDVDMPGYDPQYKQCRHCNTSFSTYDKSMVYCSPPCRKDGIKQMIADRKSLKRFK